MDSVTSTKGPAPGWFRVQDLVWLLLFAALAIASPGQTAAELEMLAAFALLQILIPRIPALNTPRGIYVGIGLRLALGFLLIGVTRGIFSGYYLILLLPILSAATSVGALGATAVTIVACLTYLAFVPIAWEFGYTIDAVVLRGVALRVLFLPLVGYLTYQLARETREAAQAAQRSADDLAVANQKLKEAEASMRRSERLAALGQLTAGLAHELRNPLGTIKASSDILLGRFKDKPDSVEQELAGYISAEVDRTNSLVTRFLEFARPMSLRLAPTDVNAMADRAIAEVVRERPESAAFIHKNYAPDISPIPADAELLERVIVNLVRNALEASPSGAMVSVRTRASDDEVEIAVLDRGPGVPSEAREQIFNPFFTTKPSGVGLGLAISAKIAGEHGGHISLESESGRGATFVVRIPISPARAQSL